MKHKILFSLILIISFSAFSSKIAASDQSPITKKVLLVVFNPVLENYGGQRLVDYLRWNDPNTLTQEYINAIKETSWNIVSYEVTEKLEFDDYPIKPDGFKYTDQSYLQCWDDHDTCHSPDIMDYPKVIADYHLCDIVNQKNYDEIWLFGGPWFGFWESATTGPNAFNANGGVYPNTSCAKLVHIMGFAYHVGYDNMLHDLGHRTERTIFGHLFEDDSNSIWSAFDGQYFRYGILPEQTPPPLDTENAHCGDVHFPPNSNYDGYYSQKEVVSSDCDDWHNYPNLTSVKTQVNCTNWGCSQEGYLRWWFTHLPHMVGVNNGKLNNWWRYVVDYERAIKIDLARSVSLAYLTDEITYDQNNDQKINSLDFGLAIR